MFATDAVGQKESAGSKFLPAMRSVASPPTAVSALPVSFVQRKASCACGGDCPRCLSQDQTKLKDNAAASGASTRAPESLVQRALHSPGKPLATADREFFSTRLATDFSNVRVHDGSEAASAADAISATAFTVSNHIVFGPGQYAPGDQAGRRLLAHELAHVAQQSSSSVGSSQPIARAANNSSAPTGNLALSEPGDASEVEADRVADAIDTPQVLRVSRFAAGPIQRALKKGCFAPSMVVTPAAASLFGTVAEALIESDYIGKKGGVPFREVFLDNPMGSLSYVAFLAAHHPSLNIALLAGQIGLSGGVLIPDILDTRGAQELYEIKPDSFDGRPAGQAKLAAIDAFMSFNSLPYTRGASYTPTPSIPIPLAGTALGGLIGLPIVLSCGVPNVTLKTVRAASGLLLYEVCVEADFDCYLKVMTLQALLLAIIIAILLGRGFPMPVPAPAPAIAAGPGPQPETESASGNPSAGVAGGNQGSVGSTAEGESAMS